MHLRYSPKALPAWHNDVHDHDIDVLPGQYSHRLASIGSFNYASGTLFKVNADQRPEVRVIVDD
jgi:hypothetical protein